MKPHEHLVKKSGFCWYFSFAAPKVCIGWCSGGLTDRSGNTTQVNKKPIQCKHFAIKLYHRRPRQLFLAYSNEERGLDGARCLRHVPIMQFA
jgi:hypothetical protein